MSIVQADLSDTLKRAEELKSGEFIYLHPRDEREQAFFGRFNRIKQQFLGEPGVYIVCQTIFQYKRKSIDGKERWTQIESRTSWENESSVLLLADYLLYHGDGISTGMNDNANPYRSSVEDLLSDS